ncbi:DUF2183 domain-containing protein [candidate division KSB1 bacterium]|nr:DUF2183 domain-containing protein [candidate division KSB1 bacterium]
MLVLPEENLLSDWQKKIAPWIHSMETWFDTLKTKLVRLTGGPGPIKIVPYIGYGSEKRILFNGRVLTDRHIPPAGKEDSVWRNLWSMIKRIDSWEIPYARLVAEFQDQKKEITADEEGMFQAVFEPQKKLHLQGDWAHIHLSLISPKSRRQPEAVHARGKVLIPSRRAQYGVISDIDDTIIHTSAPHVFRMAYNVFLANARTRQPFPGGSAFYRALHAGKSEQENNPFFYVTSGMWNIYDVFLEFFELQDIPIGPILMRNWGISKEEILPTRQKEHKLGLVQPILDAYPDLRFFLIGDSGQEDPEIYHQVVHDYPDRIVCVYIRNYKPDPKRMEVIRKLAGEVLKANSMLFLAQDSQTMAQHAFDNGWISEKMLDQVKKESEIDKKGSVK